MLEIFVAKIWVLLTVEENVKEYHIRKKSMHMGYITPSKLQSDTKKKALPILIAYRNTTTKKEMKEKMKAPMWAFQLALFDTHLIHPSALVLIICTHHFINKSWLLLGRVCVCFVSNTIFFTCIENPENYSKCKALTKKLHLLWGFFELNLWGPYDFFF